MPLTPLLFLSPRVPWPLDNGAKIRTNALLTALQGHFDVEYAGFLQPELAENVAREHLRACRQVTLVAERARTVPAKAWLALSTLADRRPMTIAKYWHAGLASRVRRWIADYPRGIIHADHLHMAPYLALGRARLGVIDEHNVEARIVERMADQYHRRALRPYLHVQARRMARIEAALTGAADLVLAVSEGDAADLARNAPHTPIEVIRNGVDLQFFAPSATDDAGRLPGRLVFTGSMNWLPNEDAVIYFVREILPLLQRETGRPAEGWSLDIVGQTPSPSVTALAQAAVRVTGTVPDVRPYIREALVYIVPLRIGGGSRLKILEAFALGIPVVSTTVGCEGLGARQGENLLIADTPETFAAAIRTLAGDPALRQRLTRQARQHVQDHFGWPAIGRRLIEVYAQALAPTA